MTAVEDYKVVKLALVPCTHSEGWFLDNKKNRNNLYNALKEASDKLNDFSNVILDISEVIIDGDIESFLYKQIEANGLTVIDNTLTVEKVKVENLPRPLTEMQEGIDYRLIRTSHGTTRTDIVEIITGKLKFRQEAFDKVKFQQQQKSIAVKLIDYFEKSLVGGNVVPTKFTRESATNLIADIRKFREHSDHRFLISMEGISNLDLASTKEIAAFLISQNKIVEVSQFSSRTTFSIRNLLPTIAQLCYDCSSTSVSWGDFRRRYPVGAEVYLSPNETTYSKYCVVQNNLISDSGEDLMSKDPLTLTEREKYDYYHVVLEQVDNLESEILTKRYELPRNVFIQGALIVLPCAILEGTDYPYGMPDIKGGELRKHLDSNQIKPRTQLSLSPNYNIFQVNEQTNASTNWINMYRKNMSKFYAQYGIELPMIDLMKIMEGQPSPLATGLLRQAIIDTQKAEQQRMNKLKPVPLTEEVTSNE